MMGTDEYVLVDVTDVRVLSRYVTELTFDDGSVKVIDLAPRTNGRQPNSAAPTQVRITASTP